MALYVESEVRNMNQQWVSVPDGVYQQIVALAKKHRMVPSDVIALALDYVPAANQRAGNKEPKSTAADPQRIEELKKIASKGLIDRPSFTTRDFEFWRREWSHAQFGKPEVRGPIGPLKHLAKEAEEAAESPKDVKEYADALHLLLDAGDRAGFTFDDILRAATFKLKENIFRKWPKTVGDEPTEHIRSKHE